MLDFSEYQKIRKVSDDLNNEYHKHNVHVQFSNHFFSRLKDPRNGKPIEHHEVHDMFKKHLVHIQKFHNMGKHNEHEVVLKDSSNDIHVPVVLRKDVYNPGKVALVPQTIMRKKNFRPKGKVFSV